MESNNEQVTAEQVIGVVVLYNCRVTDSETLTSLHKSLHASAIRLDILIYDNSPSSSFDLTEAIQLYPHFHLSYIHDPSNPGVSKAYNICVESGQQKGKTWALLLDQDTSFPENAFSAYLEGLRSFKDQVLFVPVLQSSAGIYSPGKYFFKRGMIWKGVKPGIHDLKNRTVLNSGIMVRIDAYTLAGGYNERVKLYFSDFNFIDRFKKLYKTFVVIELVCFHTLSDLANVDIEAAKKRFRYYCEGSYYSAETWADTCMLFTTVLLRAAKLSIRYRNAAFLNIFYKAYFAPGQ